MNRAGLAGALVMLGMTWGLTIPMTKIAVSTGHQPLGLIFWQMLIATVVLSAVAATRRSRPVLDRRVLWYFVLIACLGTILPNSFSYLAAAQLPAGVMSIVIATVPMCALAIALALRSERPSARRAAGVALGAAAVVLLVGPQASLPEPDKSVFVLVALIAPFCYGAEGNYIASQAQLRVDPMTSLLGASIIGTVLCGPVALATGTWVNPFADWAQAESALLFGSLLHAGAYTGYIWLVGAAGALFASQIAYVVTLSGVAFSAMLLGESYSGWVWAALALMVTGLVMVQPRQAEVARLRAGI